MNSRFLMCAPAHFDVAYVINPWMQGNVASIRPALARRQWEGLETALARRANIDLVAPAAGWPDMVFTANAGLVLDNTVVLARFKHAERRGEEPHFAKWFRDNGFQVVLPPAELAFEGAGDALLDRAQPLLWMGSGHRTEPDAAEFLSRTLDIEIAALNLVDARFYHLDTCFCPLDGGYLLYFPAAFDDASRRLIEARVPASKRIAIGEFDAVNFACNAVNIGHHVLLNRASPAMFDALAARGFAVEQQPLTEFMKAGGSAKCLTLRLDEARTVAPVAALA